jgi:hypothetical protein
VDRGPVSVVCNLREKARSFETDCKSVLLASASAIIVRNGRIELPPDSVAVLQR